MGQRTCSVTGCGRGGKLVRGWCGKHYQRWVAHGDPDWRRPTMLCSVDGCDRFAMARDLCNAHYQRKRTYGDVLADQPVKILTRAGTPVEDRFWMKVKRGRDTECWLWTGAVGSHGYGNFRAGAGYVRAHRYAYELIRGRIPEAGSTRMVLDHRCRNTLCVNPRHLDPVTDRINIHRGVGASAINVTKTHCPKGHAYDYVRRTRSGVGRDCKACKREAVRRWWQRERNKRGQVV